MGLFRRRLGGEPAQPDPVLAPLTVTEAADLVRLAERAASERGLEARYDGDGALVTEDGMVAGLTNLARAVSGIAGGTGKEIVTAHFDQLAGSLQEQPPDLPGDLDQRLYLRLVSRDGIPDEWAVTCPEFVPGVLCKCCPPTPTTRCRCTSTWTGR